MLIALMAALGTGREPPLVYILYEPPRQECGMHPGAGARLFDKLGVVEREVRRTLDHFEMQGHAAVLVGTTPADGDGPWLRLEAEE